MGIFGFGNSIKKDLEFKQANLSKIKRIENSIDAQLEDKKSLELKILKNSLDELKSTFEYSTKVIDPKKKRETKVAEQAIDDLFVKLENISKNKSVAIADAAGFIIGNIKEVVGFYTGGFSEALIISDKNYKERFDMLLALHQKMTQSNVKKESLERQKELYKEQAREDGVTGKELDYIMGKIENINADINPIKNELKLFNAQLRQTISELQAIQNKKHTEEISAMKAKYSLPTSDLFVQAELATDKYTKDLTEEMQQAVDYQEHFEAKTSDIEQLNQRLKRGGKISEDERLQEEMSQFDDEKSIEERRAMIEKM